MHDNLTAALGYILSDEGPELNVGGSEPGGASKYGVSVNALTDWHKQHGKPAATVADVAAMTPDLAGQIYTANFANPIRFDEMPPGADYRLLDIAVNLGVTGGITALQLAIGMWPITGVFDDRTMVAVNSVDAKSLVHALSAAWIMKKHESPGWLPHTGSANGYGHGWSNRNARATASAVSMIGANQ